MEPHAGHLARKVAVDTSSGHDERDADVALDACRIVVAVVVPVGR